MWKKPMPTKQPEKQDIDQDKQERQHRNALIGHYVMRTLGDPGDLHRVQVRPLWEDRYRVNVFVGVDLTSAKIAHSYFLVADSAGNVLESSPKITRQY
jgi:hypothetical protein